MIGAVSSEPPNDILRRAYALLDDDETLSQPRPAAGAEWRLPEPPPARRSEPPGSVHGDPRTAMRSAAIVLASLQSGSNSCTTESNERT